jgi:hypothetical protein
VAGYCEHGDARWDCIKCKGFLENLIDSQLIKNDPPPSSLYTESGTSRIHFTHTCPQFNKEDVRALNNICDSVL